MAKTVFFLAAILTVTAVVGSGCVPFWVHYDAVEKNKNYLTTIEGHQKEHKELARTSEEAVSRAASLEIQNQELRGKLDKLEPKLKETVEKLKQALKEGVQEAGLGAEVAGGDVKITDEGKISIAGDVLFPSGRADLTEKAKAILKKIAPMLKTQFKDAIIRIEGHTDDQPIAKPATKEKFPTNWHLSVGRAVSVLLELKNLGIPERKIYAAGYGEFKPRVPNKPKKKGHPENRRVEIAIMESK